MDLNMKDTTLIAKRRDLEYLHIQMESNIMEHGSMANNKDRENYYQKVDNFLNREIGKMGSFRNLSTPLISN